MKLNAGLIPPRLAELMANGVRVQMPALPVLRQGGTSMAMADNSDNRVLNIHPGAIVVNAPEGMSVDEIGSHIMRRINASFGR